MREKSCRPGKQSSRPFGAAEGTDEEDREGALAVGLERFDHVGDGVVAGEHDAEFDEGFDFVVDDVHDAFAGGV